MLNENCNEIKFERYDLNNVEIEWLTFVISLWDWTDIIPYSETPDGDQSGAANRERFSTEDRQQLRASSERTP